MSTGLPEKKKSPLDKYLLDEEQVKIANMQARDRVEQRKQVAREDEDLAAVGLVGKAASAAGFSPSGPVGSAVKFFSGELFREATTPISGMLAKGTDIVGLTDDLSSRLYSRNQAYQQAAAESEYRGFDNESLQYARDIFKSAASQVPTLMAGLVTGTEGLLLIYAAQAYASGVNEAKMQNKPEADQVLYGATTAAGEYYGTKFFNKVFSANTLEELVGNARKYVGRLGYEDKKLADKAVKNISKLDEESFEKLEKLAKEKWITTVRKVGAENVTPEMGEEIFVEGLQSAAAAAYGIDPDALEFQNLMESSMMAAATAATLTTPIGVAQRRLNRSAAQSRLDDELRKQSDQENKRLEQKQAEIDDSGVGIFSSMVTDSPSEVKSDLTSYDVLQQIIDSEETATPDLFVVQLQKNGLSEDEARLVMQQMVESGNVEFDGSTQELTIKKTPEVPQEPDALDDLDDMLSFDTGTIEAIVPDQDIDPASPFASQIDPDISQTSVTSKELLVGAGLSQEALDQMSDEEATDIFNSYSDLSSEDPELQQGFLEKAADRLNQKYIPADTAEESSGRIKPRRVEPRIKPRRAFRESEVDDSISEVLVANGLSEEAFNNMTEEELQGFADAYAYAYQTDTGLAGDLVQEAVSRLNTKYTADEQVDVRQEPEVADDREQDEEAAEEQGVVSEELEVADDREQEEEVDDDDVEEVIDGDLLLDDDVAVLARKVAEDVRDEIFDMSDEEYEDISSALDDLIDTTASNPRKKAAKEKLVSFAQEFNYDEEDIPNQQPRSVKSSLRRVAPQPTVSIVEDKQLTDYGRSLLVEGDLDALDQLLNPSSELPKITPTEGEARGINDGPLNKIEEGTIRTHSINGETKNSDELDPEIRDRLVAARSAIEKQLKGMRTADIRALGREIEKVSRDRGDEETITAATGRGRAALTDDFLSQVSRNLQVQINNRSKSRADAPQSRSDQDMVDMIQGILSDDAQTERSTEGSTPQAGAQAAPRRLGKSSPSRSQRAAEAVQDAQAARDAARAEFLAAFKSSVTTSAGGLGFLTDERVTRALANLIFNEAKYGQAKLKEVVALVADMIEPENAVLLKDKMVKIWGALSDNGVTDPVSDNEVQEAFAPYEKAEEDESTDRLAGGQGGTGVGSGGRAGSAGKSGGAKDGLGDVSGKDVTQDGMDEQKRRGGRGKVSGGVVGSDGKSATTRVQPDNETSPDDQRLPVPDSREDAGKRGDVSDESEAESGRGRGDRGQGDARTVSESAPVEEKPRLVPYKTGSSLPGLGVYVPENQAVALERSIGEAKKRNGDLVSFVAKETGIPLKMLNEGKALYAEQLDALALAIDSHKRGKGFVLGDMTGIGKGRVVAGMIAYSMKQGKLPVFVTAKDGLYSSMMEDLNGIGIHTKENLFNPYVTNTSTYDINEKIDGFPKNKQANSTDRNQKMSKDASFDEGSKKLSVSYKGKKDSFDGIFTTYDQLRPKNGGFGPNHILLSKLAPDAIFLLDESHKASGKGKVDEEGNEEFSTGSFIRSTLPDSAGAFFSSATFAKTASGLEVYSSTGFAQSLDNPNNIGELLRLGGDPMLQILSQGMVGDGVMIRRERDMSNTTTTTMPVKSSEGVGNRTAQMLSDLVRIDRAFRQWRRSKSQTGMKGHPESVRRFFFNLRMRDRAEKVGVTDKFGGQSVSAQITDLMKLVLVSQKTQAAIDSAVASINRNEKPIIVIDKTQQSALESYIQDNGINKGDIVNFTMQDILLSRLSKVRQVSYKDTSGKMQSYTLTDDQLPARIVRAIEQMEENIKSLGFDKYAGSPIDAIRNGVAQSDAGGKKINIQELTGRNVEVALVDGQQVYKSRSQTSKTKLKHVNGFNNGTVDALIINRSVAEGYSMHASASYKDQRKRRMIIVEYPDNISEAVQLLGRINRTGQVVDPAYDILMTDVPFEKRQLSIFIKKLKSMNANVTASTESDAKIEEIPDVMNQVGGEVLYQVLLDLQGEGINVYEAINKRPPRTEGQYKKAEFVSDITRALATAPLDIQDRVWEELSTRFDARIAELDARSANPLSAAALPLEAVTIATDVISDPSDKDPIGVVVETVRAKEPNLVLSPEKVSERVSKALGASSTINLYEDSSELDGLQAQYTDRLVRSAMEGSDSFIAEQSSKIREDESLDSIEKEGKISDIASINKSNLIKISDFSSFVPGEVVLLETKLNINGQEFTDRTKGIVVSQNNKGNLKNPTSLSQYSVTVAVLDSRVAVDIPYSQIGKNRQYNIKGTNTSARLRGVTLDDFQTASESSEVVRSIATGNTVKAYEKFKAVGSLVFYTDSEGKKKPGVLLNRGFNLDAWKDLQPIKIDSPAEAAKALIDGAVLQTSDGSVVVSPRRRYIDSVSGEDTIAFNLSVDKSNSQTALLLMEEKNPMINDDAWSGWLPDEGEGRKIGRWYVVGGTRAEADASRFLSHLIKHTEDIGTGGLYAVLHNSRETVKGLREDSKSETSTPQRKVSKLRPMDEVMSESKAMDGIRVVNPLRPSDVQRSVDYVNEVVSNQSIDPLAPLESGQQAVQAQTLCNTLDRIFAVPTWVGQLNPKKARGHFAEYAFKGGPSSVNISTQASSSIFVRLHEMGHALDRRYGITNKFRTGSSLLNAGTPAFEELKKLDYDYVRDLRVAEAKRDSEIQATGSASTPLPDVTKYSASEGFAEFFRRYMTETSVNGLSELKNEAPIALDWFESFLGKNKEFSGQVKEALEYIGRFVDQPLLTRVQAQIGRPPKADIARKERVLSEMKSVAYRTRKGIFRTALAFRRLDKQAKNAAKQLGYTLEQLEMSKRFASASKAERALDVGVFDEDTGERVLVKKEPGPYGNLAEVYTVAPIGGNEGLFRAANRLLKDDIEYQEVQVFALARHIKFLAGKRGFENYKSIMTESEADQILEGFMKRDPDQYRRFEEMSIIFSTVGRELTLMKVQAGAMDPADYWRLMDTYGADNYFPMFKIKGSEYGQDMIDLSIDPRGGARRSSSLLRTKRRSKYGDGSAIENPFVSFQKMANEYYHQAAQASILRDIKRRIDLAVDEEMGWFAEIVPGQYKANSVQLRSQLKQLVNKNLITKELADIALNVADAKEFIEKALNQNRTALDGMKDFVMSSGGLAQVNEIAEFLGESEGQAQYWVNDPTALQVILDAIDNKRVPDGSGLLSQWRVVHEEDADYNIAVVYDEAGNRVRIRMEKGVYDLTTSLGGPHKNMFVNAVTNLNRIFKNIVIGWSLDFAVQDLFRNLGSGVIRSTNIISGNPASTAAKVVYSPVKQIFKYVLPEISEMVLSPFSSRFKRNRAKMKSTHILYRNIGGSSYSIVGGARGAKERAAARKVKRGLRKRQSFIERIGSINPLSTEPYMNVILNIKDSVASFLDGLEYITALTDVPARLANAEAYIERMGYEDIGGGQFKETSTGEVTTGVPRELLVGFADAIAAAGPNFKQHGTYSHMAGPLWPFLNSSIQAKKTEVEQLKNMLSDLAKRPHVLFNPNEDSNRLRQSRRQLVMLMTTGAFGFLAQLLRGDDEDYVNGEEQNAKYWTWGWNGKTMIRIAKNPGDAWVSNIAASVAQDMFGGYGAKDRREILSQTARETLVPMGYFPGGFAGAAAQGLFNKDSWGRPVVRDHIISQGVSPDFMYDESTPYLAKLVGKYTGKLGFQVLSPITINHMVNQAFGGAPKEIGNLYDTAIAAMDGDFARFKTGVAKALPAIGTLSPNARQIQPVYNLFEETESNNTKLANMKKMELEGTEPYLEQFTKASDLQNYSDLVRKIRKQGYEDKSKKDTVDAYGNGVARFALDLGESEGSPNIFNMTVDMMPEEVQEGMMDFIDDRIAGIMPLRISGSKILDGETFFQSKMRYMDILAGRLHWVEEHMKYPSISSAMEKKLMGQEGRTILNSLKSSKLRLDIVESGMTTEEYKQLFARYIDMKVRSINLVRSVLEKR